MCAVVARGALVESLEVNGMLQRAVLDQGTLGNVLVVLGQAHDEAEIDLGVRVELAGAELDDVAQTLLGPMLALDAVVGRGAAKR